MKDERDTAIMNKRAKKTAYEILKNKPYVSCRSFFPLNLLVSVSVFVYAVCCVVRCGGVRCVVCIVFSLPSVCLCRNKILNIGRNAASLGLLLRVTRRAV